MEQLVKVSHGGQVTLPVALRQAANIEIGDYLEVALVGEQLVLSPKMSCSIALSFQSGQEP